ncbi:hypothetical protein JYT23_01215 [Mariprofundus ferrooxydans]|nr:hypothetical protein [Mariprofundus ferrooxydans]
MKTFLHSRKILFSDKYGWGDHICKALGRWRYTPFFKSFDTVDLNEFDILVPQHLTDIAYLIDHHPELNGKKCFIPPMLALETCNDKLLFNQFMIASGFGDMIPNITAIPSFPYILKKRIDEFGSRSRIIHHSKEEKIFQKFIDSDDYYRQEYITGKDEFTTHILMVGGKITFHRTLQFTFEKDLFVKGVGCKAPSGKVVPFSQIDTFESILNHLRFEGLCCFNFKLVHGQVKVFEVNPRYGGSLTRFLPKVMKEYTKLLSSC